jgi:hypothetical protein
MKQMSRLEKEAFRQDLVGLLNRHSLEVGSDTPDFVIADYLVGCLELFNETLRRRREWCDWQKKESQ